MIRSQSPGSPARTVGHFAIVPLLVLLVAGGAAPPTAAANDTFRTSWRTVQPVDELEIEDGTIMLGLDDAVSIALAQNLGLRIQRFDRATALFSVVESRSIYDLRSSALVSTGEENSPSASQLDGADVQQSETQVLNLGLDQLVPSGGVATLDWSNSRRESNSLFAQINPSFRTDFDLLFSQPLLRDFGKANTELGIRLAGIDSAISLENLELRIADTVQQVEDAYWSLVEAREQLVVARESLELAEQLHNMNQIQVDVGTKAPLELIQSEAGIASRQEEIIRAEAAVKDAEDVLRQLLNLEGDDLWDTSIEPTTPPETDRIEIDLEKSISTARAERRELDIAQMNLRKLELNRNFRENQKLPSLSLDVRYGYNGLGGDIRVSDPDADPFDPDPNAVVIPGGFGDALDQVVDAEFYGWSVALNFAFPIQNRSAEALAIIAQLDLEQGRLDLDQTSLQIRTEVRRAARAVETAAQQIDSATASRRLEEENLGAQQKRYENGLATSFQVLEIQEDLAAAKSRLVQAITGYRRALTAYYQAIGQLLESKGILIEDEDDTESLEAPRSP